jgi:predicted aldo/keto reductase-like oxidoreductase
MSGHAKNMWNEKHGADISECTECGVCAEKCPQHIKVPEKLKEVSKILSAI